MPPPSSYLCDCGPAYCHITSILYGLLISMQIIVYLILRLGTLCCFQTLERLRSWSVSRKSPDAMVSFLRISQFTVLCRGLNDRNTLLMLEASFDIYIFFMRDFSMIF